MYICRQWSAYWPTQIFFTEFLSSRIDQVLTSKNRYFSPETELKDLALILCQGSGQLKATLGRILTRIENENSGFADFNVWPQLACAGDQLSQSREMLEAVKEAVNDVLRHKSKHQVPKKKDESLSVAVWQFCEVVQQ